MSLGVVTEWKRVTGFETILLKCLTHMSRSSHLN